MDNYPPGAANDPLAPYNQPLDDQVEVLVRETLERECVLEIPVHKYQLRHYDEDLPEYYKAQVGTLPELLERCKNILECFLVLGVSSIDGFNFIDTIDELQEWKPVSIEVTE